jgi:hypothetical protein
MVTGWRVFLRPAEKGRRNGPKRVEVTVKAPGKLRILIDLEKLNLLNSEGCLACGKKFALGEEVVLARGKWNGFKYIHENEAVFDRRSNSHHEKRHFHAGTGTH